MAQMTDEQLRTELLGLQQTLAEERRCIDSHSAAELQVVLRYKEGLLARLRKVRILPVDQELRDLLQQVRDDNAVNQELCNNRLRFLRQAAPKLRGEDRGTGAYGAQGFVKAGVSSGTLFVGRM